MTFFISLLIAIGFNGLIRDPNPAPGVTMELLFSEGSGSNAADGSGNNHYGTLANSPVWGPGKYGQGLTFNGTNSFVDVSDHADFTLDPTLNYTWSAWIKNTDFHEWATVFSQTIDNIGQSC